MAGNSISALFNFNWQGNNPGKFNSIKKQARKFLWVIFICMMNAKVHFISFRLVLIELDKWSCHKSVTHMSLFFLLTFREHVMLRHQTINPNWNFYHRHENFTPVKHSPAAQYIHTDEMKGERDEQHEKALSVRDVHTFARSKTNIDCIKESKRSGWCIFNSL